MRGGDGVPWPAAGADSSAIFLRDFLLVVVNRACAKGFCCKILLVFMRILQLATMLSRLEGLLTVPCCTIDHLHSSRP